MRDSRNLRTTFLPSPYHRVHIRHRKADVDERVGQDVGHDDGVGEQVGVSLPHLANGAETELEATRARLVQVFLEARLLQRGTCIKSYRIR